MATNLLGDTLISEETITFLYKGDSFSGGKILLKPLYTELQAVEHLLRESVNIFVENGTLDKSAKDFEIYIEIEKGSFYEKVKVVFGTPTGIAIISGIVGPFLIATYTHFLNGRNTPTENPYYKEIKTIEDDQTFKTNLGGVLSPLGQDSDSVFINNGTVNITIDNSQRSTIEENLVADSADAEPKKNGEYQETLTGVIRKIDLDAANHNYLGFNIEGGPSRISTSIRGGFNLLDYKDSIDVPVRVDALVRYKDDKITHIEIITIEVLNRQEKLEM